MCAESADSADVSSGARLNQILFELYGLQIKH